MLLHPLDFGFPSVRNVLPTAGGNYTKQEIGVNKKKKGEIVIIMSRPKKKCNARARRRH